MARSTWYSRCPGCTAQAGGSEPKTAAQRRRQAEALRANLWLGRNDEQKQLHCWAQSGSKRVVSSTHSQRHSFRSGSAPAGFRIQ